MAATIRQAALTLGSPLSSPDGTEQITGHTLRATGAQGLARAGLDLWAIQLLGRWGSDAVRLYVRQASLERSATWAAQAFRSFDAASSASSSSSQSPLSEAQLKKWITQALKDSPPIKSTDASSLKEAVKEAVRDELATIAGTRGADNDEGRQLVKNLATGVVHLAAKGGSNLAGWSSRCGWKLAPTSRASFLSVAVLPQLHKLVCEKCLPSERASHKSALRAAAGSQCGDP